LEIPHEDNFALEQVQTLIQNQDSKIQKELLDFYTPCYEEYQEYLVLKAEVIAQDKSIDQLNETLSQKLWKWINRRIILVHNYHASGNDVVTVIKENTPFGLENTIIGMQNIKGTGLDFAYRWVAWNNCYKICQDLQSDNSNKIRQGVEALANFNEHGILSIELSLQSLALAQKTLATQTQYYQSQIHIIEQTIKDAQKQNKMQDTQNPMQKSLSKKIILKILEITEAFLDAGDAVKRKKRANLIYKDLTNHHISHKKAAIELQKITKRQKGGWFVQKFEN
jgi:hypothetical protein